MKITLSNSYCVFNKTGKTNVCKHRGNDSTLRLQFLAYIRYYWFSNMHVSASTENNAIWKIIRNSLKSTITVLFQKLIWLKFVRSYHLLKPKSQVQCIRLSNHIVKLRWEHGYLLLKYYNPMKPTKQGYKVWCWADMSGYINEFEFTKDATPNRDYWMGVGGFWCVVDNYTFTHKEPCVQIWWMPFS